MISMRNAAHGNKILCWLQHCLRKLASYAHFFSCLTEWVCFFSCGINDAKTWEELICYIRVHLLKWIFIQCFIWLWYEISMVEQVHLLHYFCTIIKYHYFITNEVSFFWNIFPWYFNFNEFRYKVGRQEWREKNTRLCRKVMNENYKSYTSPLKWNSSLCSFWIELLLFYFRLHSSIIFSWFERFILYLKREKNREGERERTMVDAIRYTKNFVALFVCLNYSFYIYLVCLSEQCSNHDCNRRTSYFVCGKSFYSKRNFVNIFFSSFLNNATKNCFSILSPSALTSRELSKK